MGDRQASPDVMASGPDRRRDCGDGRQATEREWSRSWWSWCRAARRRRHRPPARRATTESGVPPARAVLPGGSARVAHATSRAARSILPDRRISVVAASLRPVGVPRSRARNVPRRLVDSPTSFAAHRRGIDSGDSAGREARATPTSPSTARWRPPVPALSPWAEAPTACWRRLVARQSHVRAPRECRGVDRQVRRRIT